jgi:hypothetical protein
MSKLIIPRTYVKDINDPLIFLAGPIGNAPNWHDEAIEILFSKEPNLTIASPRWEFSGKIAHYIVEGDENYFSRARAWERHYLDISSKTGAILFWLPGQEFHDCKKVYGAMTRVELGQWMTNYKHDNNIRFCVGTDGKFSEIHTIEYDLKIDAPDKKLFNTLEQTCDEALRLSYQK